METLQQCLQQILQDDINKMIVSKQSSKTQPYVKIVIEKKAKFFQIACYTKTQVSHENIASENLLARCEEIIVGQFLQVNAFSDTAEHMVLVSRKGVCTYKKRGQAQVTPATAHNTHNRQKQYLLAEGTHIAPLVDMGVFTKDGKIVNAMYDKYKQINRFLEILDDEIKKTNATSLNVIDFGCGKSYLTFVIYYYLTQVKHIDAHIIGLDLKADVIAKCNESAQKYGYENLKFEIGDINGYKAPFDVDMVVTLHACDTATDYALYHAMQWGAQMIFSVPCCQHELNAQITPQTQTILSRYGILKERFSAIATDAIRANLLEYAGYKTQLLEFVDFDHTPKNILIRAVKRRENRKAHQDAALQEVRAMQQEFGFEPTLCALMGVEKL